MKRKVYGKFLYKRHGDLPGNLKTKVYTPDMPDWPGDSPVDPNAATPFVKPVSVFQPDDLPPFDLESIE